MKKCSTSQIISILVIMSLIGCTSMQPIEAGPDELQYKIRHENIINIHDRVKIFTEGGKEYQFQVTAIDEKDIRGKDVAVPIDSIVAVESREISIGKTSLLAGGTIGIALLIAPIADPGISARMCSENGFRTTRAPI